MSQRKPPIFNIRVGACVGLFLDRAWLSFSCLFEKVMRTLCDPYCPYFTPSFSRYKENYGTRNTPEKFRDFWETGPLGTSNDDGRTRWIASFSSNLTIFRCLNCTGHRQVRFQISCWITLRLNVYFWTYHLSPLLYPTSPFRRSLLQDV